MEFRAIGCVRSGVYYIDGRCHWIEIINYLCCEGNLFLLAPPTEHGWLTNLVGDIIIFVFHSAVCTGHSQRSRIHSLLTHSPERTHTNTHTHHSHVSESLSIHQSNFKRAPHARSISFLSFQFCACHWHRILNSERNRNDVFAAILYHYIE